MEVLQGQDIILYGIILYNFIFYLQFELVD